MKYLQSVLNFINKNKKLLGIILLIIITLFLYNSCNKYHKKEIKALEEEIVIIQDQFEEAVAEKERFKDSSLIYEIEAEQAGKEAIIFKNKAEQQRKAKEEALAALRNLPKEVIDSFFIKRYDTVTKIGVDLALDQNIGNAVVIELTEKDHLVGELVTSKQENKVLISQVGSLQNSLTFSKTALVQADSAIALKSRQFEMQQQISNYLKEDLKVAKRKIFWNKIKFTVAGIAAGSAAVILSK